MTITFSIDKQKITRTDSNVVVADSINYLNATFLFSEDWTHEKTAIFGHNGVYYHVVLVNDSCVVPVEVLKSGIMKVGVYSAYENTGIVRICTDKIEIPVLESTIKESTTPSDPTLDVYEQIIALYDQITADYEQISSIVDNLTTDNVEETETRLYVPTLPLTNGEIKFLNGDLEFTEINLGGSGYSANLIATLVDSDVVGYKTLSYTNISQQEQTVTVQATEGDKLFYQGIFGSPIDTDKIDAGTWTSNFYAKCSPNNGITKFKIEVVVYHDDTTFDTLCSEYSSELDVTQYAPLICRVVKEHFDVLPTDRLGVRIYVTTTHSSTITVNYYIGGSFPLFFTTPLALRHNQLRDLNGDSSYQHINADDRVVLDEFSITLHELTKRLHTGNLYVNGSFRLENTTWEDLCFPLITGKPTQGGKPDYDYVNVGWLFPSNDTSEIVLVSNQLKHEYKEGSNIYPHVHWRQQKSGNVVFKIQYKWYNSGDLVDENWTTLEFSNQAYPYVSGTLSQINYSLPILATGKTISSILLIKLFRDDLISGDVIVDFFDIHYQKDSVGSNEEYVKGE